MHEKFDVASQVAAEWEVNGEEADQETAESLDARFQFESLVPAECPFCRVRLARDTFADFADEDELPSGWHYTRNYSLVFCSRCMWWSFGGHESGSKCMDPQLAVIASSVAATFSREWPAGCADELAQYLRRFPDRWREVTPRQMELLVAEIFRANHRHADVMHVGKPGDGGVDVVLIDDESGKKLLVQVKTHADPRAVEPFSTLQNIIGTLVLEDTRHGVIVSTADHFSYHACRASRRAAELGYMIECIDRGRLTQLLGGLLPRAPWSSLFEHPTVARVDAEVRRRFSDPTLGAQLDLFV